MNWKFAYVQHSLIEKVLFYKRTNEIMPLKTWSRSSTILSPFIGLRFRVHNGKEFFPLQITPEMVGFKLGELVPTRARYVYKKKKKKK